ncbi:uncharacterized protein At5g39865-like [Andrographis paniculata]|uniref:uncharacterized protein At5g39865-like n=1 Tax=Andrographis paniculata TaxID=175694 RepID=UPI0021E827AB|nr:uncharacterized protein At5g39865-like [Andrographis paniculata]
MKETILKKLKLISSPKDRTTHRVAQTAVNVEDAKPARGPSSDGEEIPEPAIITPQELSESRQHTRIGHDPRPKLKPIRDEGKYEMAAVDDNDNNPPPPLPGGPDSVVLYTTSLRGIRKTFEDCNAVRFLLESFRVTYSERDVSMHMEYRDELWRILGGRVVPPRLFVRGRYVGGADEAVGLHEKGRLQILLQGIPLSPSDCPCRGCAGMRFVLCSDCDGSRKVRLPDGGGVAARCPRCNENGLVKCWVCM